MKRIILLSFILMLSLSLFASILSESPLVQPLYGMDYGDYETEKCHKLSYTKEGEKGLKEAHILYGDNHVEYYVSQDHTAELFMTKEGSLFLFDGIPLDVTKASKENNIFAEYMKTLSSLLQDHYEDFVLSSTFSYKGYGKLEEKPLEWEIQLKEEQGNTFLSYRYTFQDGESILLEGKVETKEIATAKTLADLPFLPSFEVLAVSK